MKDATVWCKYVLLISILFEESQIKFTINLNRHMIELIKKIDLWITIQRWYLEMETWNIISYISVEIITNG